MLCTLVDTNMTFAIWNVCFESHECVCLPCQKPLCLLWPAVTTSNITRYANGHISGAFPTSCVMFTLHSSGLGYSWPSLGNLVCQIKKLVIDIKYDLLLRDICELLQTFVSTSADGCLGFIVSLMPTSKLFCWTECSVILSSLWGRHTWINSTFKQCQT